jgi:hypothetical protein
MANLEIPNHKSQTPNKFQLPKSTIRNILLVIWALELGIYLEFGLPARSPAMGTKAGVWDLVLIQNTGWIKFRRQ